MSSGNSSNATTGATYNNALNEAATPWWSNTAYAQGAASQLNKLASAGPAGVTTDPGYQNYLTGNLQNQERQAASMGQTYSGNEIAALANLNNQSSLNYYDNQVNVLSSLAGVNNSPASAVGAATGAANVGLAGNKYSSQLSSQGLGGLSNGLSSLLGNNGLSSLSSLFGGSGSAGSVTSTDSSALSGFGSTGASVTGMDTSGGMFGGLTETATTAGSTGIGADLGSGISASGVGDAVGSFFADDGWLAALFA